MLLDIIHQPGDFLSVCVSCGSADLVGEYLHDLPVHPLALVGQFHHLPFVVLSLCRDPCQNCYLVHHCFIASRLFLSNLRYKDTIYLGILQNILVILKNKLNFVVIIINILLI